MTKRIRVSIVGVTGYTGLELLRVLLAHPQVDIACLTSRQHEKEKIGNLYPHLAHLDLFVTNPAYDEVVRRSDVVFLALPHKTAQGAVAELHGKVRLIDLSADFRLKDPAVYEKYYESHQYPHLLQDFVYGLPEVVGKQAIRTAQNIANPGCFALLAQLLLYPFRGRIAAADIFAVTGSSGSGKTPGDGTHHPVRNHNMQSYNINKHRHIPEIISTAGIDESQLNFIPTSGPFTRGIFTQAFITLKDGDGGALPADVYADCPFVRLQEKVALANVVGSNFADLSFKTGRQGKISAQGAIDNLVKGAAGSAVQNMNLMFNLDETTGLSLLTPVYP
jgi:N-acetyl-gamma-glutamyl-phosphate reductase